MKYVLLIYRDEKASAKASPADLQKEGAAYDAFTKSIKDSGNFLDGDPFEPTGNAQTVEVRGGTTQTRNGPADTAKLQLGAYYKVEAKSPEEAAEMASRIPGATYGSIEVRPVWDPS
jgi:hypothetical protein